MPESPGPVVINRDRLLENFVAMLSVDSFHGDEDRVEAIIRPALEPLGIRFSHDAIGNLIGCWPGRGRSDGRIMLNAHMDTVQPTPNMRPVVDADGVRSDGSSVLGADDKAGLAAIIEAIRAVTTPVWITHRSSSCSPLARTWGTSGRRPSTRRRLNLAPRSCSTPAGRWATW